VRIAIVGAGVSGLGCAHWLAREHEVTVFESGPRLGGHINTVEVEFDAESHQVDTGFIVYNELNYPLFSKLLSELGVASQPSDMSFSVSCEAVDFEYRGNGLGLWA
jgi:predicted NAD/FAD-binding protein